MINKLYTPKDFSLNQQIDEIIANQFVKSKEVTVIFTAANTTVPVDIGFKVDRYLPISKTANVTIWHTDSDNKYLYLQSSGVAIVVLKVWKTEV